MRRRKPSSILLYTVGIINRFGIPSKGVRPKPFLSKILVFPRVLSINLLT